MSDLTERINEALDGTTPGPWRQVNGLYDDSDGGCEVWADRDAAGWDAFMVATTLTRLNPNPTSHAAEDARLIAAAPSLLREAAERLTANEREIERLEVLDTYAEWEKSLIQDLRDQAKAARKSGTGDALQFKLVADDPEHMHRTVVGALRSAIDAHGPVDREWIGSAAKRVVAALRADGAS